MELGSGETFIFGDTRKIHSIHYEKRKPPSLFPSSFLFFFLRLSAILGNYHHSLLAEVSLLPPNLSPLVHCDSEHILCGTTEAKEPGTSHWLIEIEHTITRLFVYDRFWLSVRN